MSLRTKIAVVVVVVLAAVAVIWAKPATEPPAAPVQAESPTQVTVVLAADPREAGSSCGCGQIIALARGAGEKGAMMLEFDPRDRPEEAKRLGVRVSPTVLVLGTDGSEEQRFEGESPEVVENLRKAIEALP